MAKQEPVQQTPDFMWLPAEQIRPHPNNPRKELGDLAELTASIREQGVMEPLVVEALADAGEGGQFMWQLLSGHRRLAAASAAGVKKVPAVVYGGESPLGRQLERMLTENLQRSDLTAVEEGDAYQALLDLPEGDYTAASIAKKVGRSRKHVTAMVKVAGLPESARDRVMTGQVTIDDATAMAEFAADKEALARVEQAADQGGVSFRAQIQTERMRVKREKEHAAALHRARKTGLRVFDGWGDPELPGDVCDVDDIFESEHGELLDDPSDEQQVIDEHAECPGHAIIVSRGGSESTECYICTDPDKYHTFDQVDSIPRKASPSASTAAAPDPQQAEADRRAREELELQLRAAGVTRRQWLGELLLQRDQIADLAKAFILERVGNCLERNAPYDVKLRQRLADVLLPNLSDTARENDLTDRLRTALNRLSLAQLVVIDDIRNGLGWGEYLEHPADEAWSAWRSHDSSPGGRWRSRLENVYGYPWSAIERAQMPTTDDDADGQEATA